MDKCKDCGMPVELNEYHPFAACLMFTTCRNSKTVTENLNAVLNRGLITGKVRAIEAIKQTQTSDEIAQK